MSLEGFVNAQVGTTLNEDLFGAMKVGASNKIKGAYHGARAKMGSDKAKGALDTMEQTKALMANFHRYLGRQGINDPKKDDLALFMENMGLAVSDEQMLKIIYGSKGVTDFPDKEEANEAIATVSALLQDGEGITEEAAARIMGFADTEGEAYVRYALHRVARQLSKNAAQSWGPISSMVGGPKLSTPQAQQFFTYIARSVKMNDDPREKQKKADGSQAKDANDNFKDSAEEPAFENCRTGEIFTILKKRHGLSMDTLVRQSQQPRQELKEQIFAKLATKQSMDLIVSILQFYVLRNDKMSRLKALVSEEDKDNMVAAISSIESLMHDHTGFNRGQVNKFLYQALFPSDEGAMAKKERASGFLAFLIVNLHQNRTTNTFNIAQQAYKQAHKNDAPEQEEEQA